MIQNIQFLHLLHVSGQLGKLCLPKTLLVLADNHSTGRQMTAVYCDSHDTDTDTLGQRNAEFLDFKASVTYSFLSAVMFK
jgi:hypothetical protein